MVELDDRALNKAARWLFLGAAPERKAELNKLWDRYSPHFHLVREGSGDNLVMRGGGLAVLVGDAAIVGYWVGAYAAWAGFDGMTARGGDLSRFKDVVGCFGAVAERPDDPWSVPLPVGIPTPRLPWQIKDRIVKAPADLATVAVCCALLHEVGHLTMRQDAEVGDERSGDGDSRDRAWREEMACDEGATSMLLDRAAEYAETEGEEVERVLRKRGLGIYFHLFTMCLIAMVSGVGFGESDTHPALQTRIDAVSAGVRARGGGGSEWVAREAFKALRLICPECAIL